MALLLGSVNFTASMTYAIIEWIRLSALIWLFTGYNQAMSAFNSMAIPQNALHSSPELDFVCILWKEKSLDDC